MYTHDSQAGQYRTRQPSPRHRWHLRQPGFDTNGHSSLCRGRRSKSESVPALRRLRSWRSRASNDLGHCNDAGHRSSPPNTSSTLPLTMLANTARRPRNVHLTVNLVRSFATEHTLTSSTSAAAATNDQPPPLSKHPTAGTTRPRTRLNPSPRPATSSNNAQTGTTLRQLPPNFGQNQLLSVPNSTRAVLEEIVAQFRAPIRYAFAYGSGVFEQDGYASMKTEGKTPMLDFMFAVRHPDHWHSINMNQFPSHYPLHARMLGSDFVSRVQEVGPGVWFNAFVQVNGVVSICTLDSLSREHL